MIDAAGRPVRKIVVPTPFVTNLAFGPDGADTLFITGAFDQCKPPYPGFVYRWTPKGEASAASAKSR